MKLYVTARRFARLSAASSKQKPQQLFAAAASIVFRLLDYSAGAGAGEGVRGIAGVIGAAGSEIFGVPGALDCVSDGQNAAHMNAASTIAASTPRKSITPDVVGASLL
jgi:hypothetical protein